MIKLTTIKKAFLTGIVAASMVASSLTAFAATAETPHIDAVGTTITLPVKQTFALDDYYKNKGIDQKVTYTLTPATQSHQDFESNTAQAVKDGDITYTIGDKDVSTFTLNGNDAKTDIVFNLNKVGLYVFNLSVDTQYKALYDYDHSEYRIRVYHKNNDTSFVTVQKLTSDDKVVKVGEIVYNHAYIPVVTNDPPVQKFLEGDTPSKDGSFHFEMNAISPANAPKPATSKTEISIADLLDHDKTYRAEIGDITFTEPGTYVYEVKEVSDGLDGFTYDTTIYIVTYKVETDPATKVLVANREIKVVDNIVTEGPNFAYTFTNSYKASGNGGSDGGHHGGDGYGSVVVYKVDAASDNTRLSGVRFEVTKTNGDYVTTITTDDKGMAAINSLPVATYRLKELNTPDGYQAENRYIYFTVIKDTTVASPTNVKVTNTKATENQHIVAIKQWANVDGVAIPDSVTFELTKDGVGTGVTQIASAANNWTVDFGLVPADGTYDIVETNVPDGYAVSYEKAVNGQDVVYTITNTNTEESGAAGDHQNAYTGDSSNMMLYAGVMGAAIICLAGWFVVNKRTR